MTATPDSPEETRPPTSVIERRQRRKPRCWQVRAHRAGLFSQLREMWSARIAIGHLLVQFILRAYQRTFLGISWLFIRPFVMVAAYTFVFRDMLNVQTGDTPYPIFVLCNLLGWLFFQRGLAWATRGLYKSRAIIRRYYLPRLLVYLSSFGPALVESGVVLICLIVAVFFYLFTYDMVVLRPDPRMFYLPLVLVWFAAAVSAITLFTSVLYMYGKDVWYVTRYATIGILFATPVLYPIDAVPPEVAAWMAYNPLTPIFITLRSVVLGTEMPSADMTLFSICVLAAMNMLGLWFFLRWEAAALDETV